MGSRLSTDMSADDGTDINTQQHQKQGGSATPEEFDVSSVDDGSILSQEGASRYLNQQRQLDPLTVDEVRSLPIVSHYEYALMCLHVYKDPDQRPLLPGWRVFMECDAEGLNKEGYYGIAYINDAKRAVVIAERGTADSMGVRAAVWMYFGEPTIQFSLAEQFSKLVYLKLQLSGLREEEEGGSETGGIGGGRYYTVSYTGHSLGGVIATCRACAEHTFAICFEAPGCKDYVKRVMHPFKADAADIITYLRPPNPINSCRQHCGYLVQLPSYKSPAAGSAPSSGVGGDRAIDHHHQSSSDTTAAVSRGAAGSGSSSTAQTAAAIPNKGDNKPAVVGAGSRALSRIVGAPQEYLRNVLIGSFVNGPMGLARGNASFASTFPEIVEYLQRLEPVVTQLLTWTQQLHSIGSIVDVMEQHHLHRSRCAAEAEAEQSSSAGHQQQQNQQHQKQQNQQDAVDDGTSTSDKSNSTDEDNNLGLGGGNGSGDGDDGGMNDFVVLQWPSHPMQFIEYYNALKELEDLRSAERKAVSSQCSSRSSTVSNSSDTPAASVMGADKIKKKEKKKKKITTTTTSTTPSLSDVVKKLASPGINNQQHQHQQQKQHGNNNNSNTNNKKNTLHAAASASASASNHHPHTNQAYSQPLKNAYETLMNSMYCVSSRSKFEIPIRFMSKDAMKLVLYLRERMSLDACVGGGGGGGEQPPLLSPLELRALNNAWIESDNLKTRGTGLTAFQMKQLLSVIAGRPRIRANIECFMYNRYNKDGVFGKKRSEAGGNKLSKL